MSSSDDDMPVVKKPVKKPVVADDSDDDMPVVKKPVKKPVVADDSDDDMPVVKKPVKKPVVASDSDDDEAPVVKKPAAKKAPAKIDSDSDSDAPVTTRKKHADPARGLDSDSDSDEDVSTAALVDLIDYDSMGMDAFVAHLKAQTKAQRLEEKRTVAEKRAEQASSSNDDTHFDGSAAYSYDFMLQRILDRCRSDNPESGESERIRLPMPRIEKSGSKKTALTNFVELCKAVNRTQDEVKDYIEKSLTTQGSVDANNCLILKYQNAKVAQFEKLFVKYVNEYVKCRACGRITTTLTKDASSRLLLMQCSSCGASRYIQVAAGATFKAQTSKRSKARNNAMT